MILTYISRVFLYYLYTVNDFNTPRIQGIYISAKYFAYQLEIANMNVSTEKDAFYR